MSDSRRNPGPGRTPAFRYPVRATAFFGRFGVSFRGRDFRYLWLSDSAISCAEQMEFLALAWFILQETDSPFLLGLYAALRFTGTLLSPLYGIVVDRYDRKRLLQAVRAGFALSALVILGLASSGLLQVWHVFALVAAVGMARAFDTVTRQTIIPDVVPRESIMNAVALTRTGRDIMQIVGPMAGGILLSRYGMGWIYVAVVAMYLVGVALSFRMRAIARSSRPQGGESLVSNIRQALGYVRRREVVLGLLLLAFLVNLTGFPLNNGLLPVYARDILNVGATGLGQLLGAYSAGAMLGSVVIASVPQFRRPGALMTLAGIGWHLSIIALALISWFGPAIGVLALAGLSQSFTMVTMAMLLLSVTDPDIRGRIMGLRSLAVYGLPLGLLASGALADLLGASVALTVNGAIGIAFGILIAVLTRQVWRYTPASQSS